MAVSNNITSFLNFISFLCSIPILASGIWLASKPDTDCVRWFRWPLLSLGIAILLVSLAGFVGTYYRKRGLLSLYLFFMAALIVSLLVLIILAAVVTSHSGAYSVPGRAYREYRLDGFSWWLRDHITNSENWGNIRACLVESNTCAELNRGYFSAEQFFAARISPLQSGCCKPPTICGYQYVNPTMWVNPTNIMVHPDCFMWNNDPTKLCYNCDSCKAGLLGNLRREWRKTEVALIVAVVLLIVLYLIACNAYKNSQIQRK